MAVSDYSPCKICLQSVTTNAIACDKCQAWLHQKCVNLRRIDIQRLTSSSIHWECPPCQLAEKVDQFQEFVLNFNTLAEMKTMTTKIQLLKRDLNETKVSLCRKSSSIDLLTSEVQSLKTEVYTLQDALSSVMGSNAVLEWQLMNNKHEVFQCCADAFSRQKSVVLVNIPEPLLQDTMAQRRFFLQQIASVFGIVRSCYPLRGIQWCLRLGKYDKSLSNPRAVLVEFDSRDSRDELLRKAYLLSKSEFHRVGILPDRPLACKLPLAAMPPQMLKLIIPH